MKETVIKLISLSLVAVFAIFFGSASAKSQCKSLDQKACFKAPDCTWVKGYTTAKGVKVSAYCRSKGGKKKTLKQNAKKSSYKTATQTKGSRAAFPKTSKTSSATTSQAR